MDVRAYVERQGELVEDSDLHELTPAQPSSNFPAACVSVSIGNPVAGGANVAQWRLPSSDPLEFGDRPVHGTARPRPAVR